MLSNSNDDSADDMNRSQQQSRRLRKYSGGTFSESAGDNDSQFQGRVAIHPSASRPSTKQHGQNNRYPSSWATEGSGRYQATPELVTEHDGHREDYNDGFLPRSRTPNMSNLSAAQSPFPSAKSTKSRNDTVSSRYKDQQTKKSTTQIQDESLSIPPEIEDVSGKDSFKGWLASSLLDVLNTAAGFTISTTGTILSPPLAMTKNVILPGILAIIVDTLDNITPPRVQDWFRILSSSIYHLYSVLKSTEQGQKFRHQLFLVFQNFFEVWSAPESRQVVVDGMVAGVKLADALQ
jgi:hypothetical protein